MSDAGGHIDTMLRHLGSGHDFESFPGTTDEKLGLMLTASARGLIAWSKARGRYELTRVGWDQLAPRRGFGLASLAVCASIGAVIGAGALAAVWLPADASYSLAGRQVSAPVSRPVDPGGGLPTPPQTASASPVAPKVHTDQVPTARPDTPMEPAQVATKVQTNPVPAAQHDTPMEPEQAAPKVQTDPVPSPSMEPVRVAEQPVPEQPIAAAPTSTKQAAVKKSRHKTVRARTYGSWAWANSYRDDRYSGFGRMFR